MQMIWFSLIVSLVNSVHRYQYSSAQSCLAGDCLYLNFQIACVKGERIGFSNSIADHVVEVLEALIDT